MKEKHILYLMSNVVTKFIVDEEPGKGMNANPFEAEIYLDFTSPLGSLSGQIYSLMFQLGKNGFYVFKMGESVDVSPVFKQYYDLTIQQKQALEAQTKAGLGQIATAIHDFELISHDLRKYKEYLDYFTKIEKGNEMVKSKKKDEVEKGGELRKEGLQTLRSVFIDQVDAHTGEGIALRTITQRWPTIIVDFMRLDDKDVDQKKIAQSKQISEAEASILATKNKLFIEWRDSLFKPTLRDRYQNVLRLVEARKTSIQRYTEMLRPVVARFRMINDMVQGTSQAPSWKGFWLPGTQAYSLDTNRIWAFMPFAPSEKYKVTREFLDSVPARKAGFTKDEIEQLSTVGENPRLRKDRPEVPALPVEPSIDDLVREYVPQVERYYNVQINILDVFDARKRLTDLFLRKAMQTQGGMASSGLWSLEGGTSNFLSPGQTWLFSPYYVFLDLPFERAVVRLANGSELEDTALANMTVKNRTQNVVIVTLLEQIAREKQLDNYISQLLGESGISGYEEVGGRRIPILKSIEELSKEQYPEIFGKASLKLKGGKDVADVAKKFKWFMGDFMNFLGSRWGLHFDWLRARGDYEFAMDDRMAEMFQLETMFQGYLFILRYLQRGAGVPGIRV